MGKQLTPVGIQWSVNLSNVRRPCLSGERNLSMVEPMNEITLLVVRDEESGGYVASWDEPRGNGGITTQGADLTELQTNIREAVRCHFGSAKAPQVIRMHFITDPVLVVA